MPKSPSSPKSAAAHPSRKWAWLASGLLPYPLLLCPLLLALGCTPSKTDTSVSAPPCDGSGLTAGDHARTQVVDGLERTWSIHLPPGADSTSALPVVLNLHPFVLGGNEVFHELWRTESGLEALADMEGFIVVHPEGTGDPAAWNAGQACCGDASADEVDDVGFLLHLIESVSQETCVDERRVYATGMSNGGYLSHRLACENPDRVAAIAPVVGSLSEELVCADGRAVPVLQISGSEDNLTSRQASVDHWVDANECTGQAQVTENGAATCTTATDCRDGVSVTHCVISEGGHCWFSDHQAQVAPGCDPVDFVSEQEAWDFFSQWALP